MSEKTLSDYTESEFWFVKYAEQWGQQKRMITDGAGNLDVLPNIHQELILSSIQRMEKMTVQKVLFRKSKNGVRLMANQASKIKPPAVLMRMHPRFRARFYSV
ncbi:hypothetical protein [Martelella alba]|uniref:hypothetical protein n=1 Tax=Martelella alba TaxID=2590451 RepID=UPI00403D3B61